jgi:hypothetical protein
LDGLIEIGVDKDRSERGLAARVGVKRRDAHEPMYPVFGSQVTIGPITAHLERGALDASLFARLMVEHFNREAMALTPAEVHAQEHLRPVLGIGPARSRIDGDECRGPVFFTRQHAREFHAAHRRLDCQGGLVCLFGGGLVTGLIGQFEEHLGVFEAAPLLLPIFGQASFLCLLAKKRLCVLLVTPKIGCTGDVIDFGDPPLRAFDVKDAPLGRRASH